MAEQTPKHPPVAPYLVVDNGVAAIDVYKRAFGAEEGARYDYEGRVGHVSWKINGADVMMSDGDPEYAEAVGTLWPKTLGGAAMTLTLSVDDVDVWFDRALAVGATPLRPPKDEF